MRVLVIGGSGHIGTYLIPQLIEAEHEVVEVSRGAREPYQPDPRWSHVRRIAIDRTAAEADGSFGARIHELQPDVVIDLICFTPQSAAGMVEALRGNIGHYISCGTVWVHGPSQEIPVTEQAARGPFGHARDYCAGKAEMELYLLDEAGLNGFPATVVHPGFITGPGWPVPISPLGNYNQAVFAKLARGETVALPNFGMEAVHHVHAADVAQVFHKAMQQRANSIGESFHALSSAALTLKGYAEAAASWFGRTADLSFLPWPQWKMTVSDEDAIVTRDTLEHNFAGSISKAERLLGYQPQYSSLEAVRESLMWQVDQGKFVI